MSKPHLEHTPRLFVSSFPTFAAVVFVAHLLTVNAGAHPGTIAKKNTERSNMEAVADIMVRERDKQTDIQSHRNKDRGRNRIDAKATLRFRPVYE